MSYLRYRITDVGHFLIVELTYTSMVLYMEELGISLQEVFDFEQLLARGAFIEDKNTARLYSTTRYSPLVPVPDFLTTYVGAGSIIRDVSVFPGRGMLSGWGCLSDEWELFHDLEEALNALLASASALNVELEGEDEIREQIAKEKANDELAART